MNPNSTTRPASSGTAIAATWQQELAEAYTQPQDLLRDLGLPAVRVETRFPMRVPRSFAARMHYGDSQDPLLRQVLPIDAENRVVPGFGNDPVGDMASLRGHGLMQKYRGRALLIATGACAVHCRYCFRREFPYSAEATRGNQLGPLVAQIEADADINEIILSGGDPLSLSDTRLTALVTRVAGIDTIRRIRIHTRLPVVVPQRVTDELLNTLHKCDRPIVLVLHSNHAQELDSDVAAAIARLADAGVTLLNQSVLLRGVNDCVDDLVTLSERLFDCGVLPYYLHQLDPVAGAAHFAVDDTQAARLIGAAAARLPGYLLPRLVREQAGATAKQPLPVDLTGH
jgi:EF-P beta-lysylation protein EpmB